MTSRRKPYPDSPTRSAELLRMALPLMSRQAAPVHPLAYAVWYEHVAGRNAALSAEIQQRTADGALLDDAATAELYERHLADPDADAVQRAADQVQRAIHGVSQTTERASAEAARLDDSLGAFEREAGTDSSAVALDRVLGQTREIRATFDSLQAELQQSKAEMSRLREEIERTRQEALVDTLTGLANRRAFDHHLQTTLAQPAPRPACLLMGDIDHFKQINDTWGHMFGDQVLRSVAQAILACVTKTPGGVLAARVGGEEFAVVLPDTMAPQAQALAERIRATVASAKVRRRDRQETIGQVTLSLGVAMRQELDTATSWYDRADQALYASKLGGRNRVTVAA